MRPTWITLICLALLGCSASVLHTPKNPPLHYLSVIQTEADFGKLAGKQLSSKFSNIASIKVLYRLRDKQIFFVNSALYKFHYDFSNEYLGRREDLYFFNEKNYSAHVRDREYLLGNLNHVKGTSTYFLELAASDLMDVPEIRLLHAAVKKNVHMCDTLHFYLNNYRLLQPDVKEALELPTITSEDLFGTLRYQQVSEGKTEGILKKYTLEELEQGIPSPQEIIIVNGTPLTLPHVRGVIVTELQTPLSHLVLLGRNRQIPIVAQLDAWESPLVAQMIGKPVLLEAREDSMRLSLLPKLGNTDAGRPEINLPKDLTKTELVDLDKIPKGGTEYIGSKAFHFACLSAISEKKESFKVPEYAFAIPFYYYQQHLEKSGAAALVNEIYKEAKDKESLKMALKKIRNSINDYPLDGKLLQMVETRLKSQSEFKAFRFRSSTNAEDLDEFNGAGLYDSKSVLIGDTAKTVEKAIKKIWASVWSEAAFTEREIFRIKQSSVAMGILVHRSFPDEEANGVVITANIYRENEGITVNVQKGESSVVLPEKGITTEIFTAYKYWQPPWDYQLIVDYTSHSPLNAYKPILNEKEMETLYKACMQIDEAMERYWQQDAVCDIEFKIVGAKRELYIKQVRMY